MNYLKGKMKKLIGVEIGTPFGPCEVLSVDDEFVELKDVADQTFKVPLWRFGQ